MRLFLLSLAIVIISIVGVLLSPIGPIPGGALSGDIVADSINDWSFVKEERFCKLETQSPEPRSITVTCIVADKQLYVGCSSCPGRNWSQQLTKWPNVRYGTLGNIYTVNASRVHDQHELDQVWLARAEINGKDSPGSMPDDFWFFRLVSR